MYEKDGFARQSAPTEGWMMTCITVRSDEQFLSTQWLKALQKVLDLAFSDLPSGRSWKAKLANASDPALAEDIQQAFLETLMHATNLLTNELGRAAAESRSFVNASAIEALINLLDSNKFLYHYVSAARIRNNFGDWENQENEGFTEAHRAILERFVLQTNNCEILAQLLRKSGDVTQVTKLVKLVSTIKQKAELPTLPWLLECACEGLENASIKSAVLPNRSALRDVVEDIMRLSDPDSAILSFSNNRPSQATSMPVETWKRIALNWFNSDKLKLRRAGLEQLGEVCKHLNLNCGETKQSITNWLRSARVFEITFVERFDERVIPCVEELLTQVEIDQAMIDMLLKRAGSKSVQKALGNVCQHSSFSEATSSRLLIGASRAVLINGDMDAASLLLAALSESKQTRLNLLRKGKRCALAVVRALVAVLVVTPRGNEAEEIQTSDALYLVCLEMEAKSLRRYVIDLLVSTLLPSESFLPESVKMRMDDMESMYGVLPEVGVSSAEGEQQAAPSVAPLDLAFPSLVRPDANREAAYRALRKMLSTYSIPGGGGFSSSFSQNPLYQEYHSRGECLRSIEEEWSFRDLFFSDLDVNCASEKAIWPRLDLFSFFLRFSPVPTELSNSELVRLWEKARALSSQETFCFWLASCASRDCNPCIPLECMRSALEGLLTKEELRKGGDRTYLCMQTLFIEVNASHGLLDAEQGHEAGSKEHRQTHPAADKAGSKLIGRRVSVLHSDGRMQQGIVSGYKDVWGKHVVEYFTGTVEEKPMDELNEWWLLPSPEKSRAGGVKVRSVRKGEPLIGLENIWIMALESENESVSDLATDLLVAMHRRSMSEAFIERTYEELKEACAALQGNPSRIEDQTMGDAPDMEVDMHTGLEVDYNRTAIRCIELLRNLDVCTRSFLANGSQRIVSHGHRSRGVPLRVIVDMNHPPPVVAVGPVSQIASSANSPVVSSTTFDFMSNTFVDEFVQRICSYVSASIPDGCQVSIDPQSESFFGGLGVPVTTDEPGADSCTLEEIGALPGSVATRATLGSKNLVFGPNKKPADASTCLAIVPYDFDAATSSPPRSNTNSPPLVVSPDLSYSGSQSPAPSPVLDSAPETPTVHSEPSSSTQPPAGTKTIVPWSYPDEQYAILFDLLESDASVNLKRLIWEFLQSTPTCTLDEDLAQNVDTAVCDSYWRSLYRFQIIGARHASNPNSMRGALSDRDAEELVRLIEELLTMVLSREPQAQVVVPSVTGVLLWAIEIGSRTPLFPAELFATRISSLLLLLTKELKDQPGVKRVEGAGAHECSPKDKRVPPPARLCDECLRTRRMIRASMEAMEALRLTLQAGGESLWNVFFPSPLAQELIWTLAVTHPIVTIRDLFAKAFGSTNSPEFVQALIVCEKKLEIDGDLATATACEQFFDMLTERITEIRAEDARDMFSRLVQVVFNWRERRQNISVKQFPGTTLFTCFTRLVAKLVPVACATSPSETEQLISRSLSLFLLNTADIGIIQNEQARSAIASLVCALVKSAPVSSSVHGLTIEAIDDFLSRTPVPLRRQDKGWGFEIDWCVDPTSNDGNGLKLRNAEVASMGLLNRGSTCYVNSVLQMLFSVQPFREALLTAKVTPKEQETSTTTATTTKTRLAGIAPPPPPPPPPPKQKQSIAKAWQCWCTGVNDLTATTCRICEMPRPEDYEIVSESFSYAVPNELMMQVQQTDQEEEEPIDAFQRSTSGGGNNSSKDDQAVEILRQMQRAFAFLAFGRQSCYDPYKLIMASKPLNLQFPVTSQNDASEYYDKLLDALDQGLKREGNDTAVETLKRCFLGKQVKMKRCQVCENVSLSKDEEFYRLELTVKNESETKNDLSECLEAFTAPEDMFGENKVDCDFCQTRTNTTFVTCLTQIPRFLFIHPKRFTYDLESNQTVKLNHFISFPESLDLFPLTKDGVGFGQAAPSSPTQQQQDASKSPAPSSSGDDDMIISRPPSAALPVVLNGLASVASEVKQGNLMYDLKGVLVHRGRAGGGHYYSLIHGEEGETTLKGDKRWVLFNDDRVSGFDSHKLAEECFGGKVERSNMDQWGISRTETLDNEKSAFMLLYVKRETSNDVTMETAGWSPEDPLGGEPNDDAMEMDLSHSDMFFPHSDSIYKEKSLSSIVEDDEGDLSDDNDDDDEEEEESRQQQKLPLASVPKPIAAFSKMSSIETSALARAHQLQHQSLTRMMEVSPPIRLNEKSSLATLKREVEETSLAVIRQAILFSPVTQQLVLDVLCEAESRERSSMLEAKKKGDGHQDRVVIDSDLLIVPAFRFFFQVVAKSKFTNDDHVRRWITRSLHPISAGSSFEHRTSVADALLSAWMEASELETFDVEIGPAMNSAQFSLVEILLDCPEKRVRTFYLEGLCVLLGDASQVTIQTLLRSTLQRFDLRYQEQQTQAKQKVYLESLLGLLRRIVIAGSGSTGKQLLLECDVLGVIVKALITPSPSQPNMPPSLELLTSCCDFIAGYLPSQSLSQRPASLESLGTYGMRNILLDVGLSGAAVPESVLQVLVEHVRIVCSGPEFDFESLVDRLLELIHVESSASGSSSNGMNELPYDTTIVSNVLTGMSVQASFLGRVLLIGGSFKQDLLEFGLVKVITTAAETVLTGQVREILLRGGAAVTPSLPRHSTWEEKLFPVDANKLRFACRLMSVIVQNVVPGTGSSSQSRATLQRILSSNDDWNLLCYWFLACTSPFNQMMYSNGMDTEVVRKMRKELIRLKSEGLAGAKDIEEQAWWLVGRGPEDICFVVENAGLAAVNGVYLHQLPTIQQHARWMSENGLSIYRCALSNGSEEWFLSKLEIGLHPSDEKNVDFYSTSPFPKSCQALVPHPAEWNTLSKGRPPGPMVRKILVRDLPQVTEEQHEDVRQAVKDELVEGKMTQEELDDITAALLSQEVTSMNVDDTPQQDNGETTTTTTTSTRREEESKGDLMYGLD